MRKCPCNSPSPAHHQVRHCDLPTFDCGLNNNTPAVLYILRITTLQGNIMVISRYCIGMLYCSKLYR